MSQSASPAPLALPILDACKALGIGRTFLYEMIQRGEVRTLRLGSRRLVPVAELERIVRERTDVQEAA